MNNDNDQDNNIPLAGGALQQPPPPPGPLPPPGVPPPAVNGPPLLGQAAPQLPAAQPQQPLIPQQLTQALLQYLQRYTHDVNAPGFRQAKAYLAKIRLPDWPVGDVNAQKFLGFCDQFIACIDQKGIPHELDKVLREPHLWPQIIQ